MKLKVAFATNDNKNLYEKHFGDANFYHIYEISKNESVFLYKKENTTDKDDEKFHGDPQKAKKIKDIIKNVHVVCNKQFGKNIVKIRKKYVPIVSKINDIEQNIKLLQEHFDKILIEWNKGENRQHIKL